VLTQQVPRAGPCEFKKAGRAEWTVFDNFSNAPKFGNTKSAQV